MTAEPLGHTTMDDVARHAGVSKASVSRVLNNVPGTVGADTTRRILDAIEQLGYVPDRAAASLKARRTHTIGLLLTDVGNPFFATVAAGVESVIQDAGYSLILASSASDHDREVALTRVMLERRIDALVVATASTSDAHLLDVRRRGIELVLVDAYPTQWSRELDCIMVDNRAGAAEATRHLLDLGHRDIGVVAGRHDDSSSLERVQGVEKALGERGLALRPDRLVRGDFSAESGRRAGLELLQGPSRPTAVFSANNLMTVGVLEAMADLGLVAPAEVSLVGFDDMDWYPLARPAITAVAQPAHEIGARAARRLLLRLNSESAPPAETELLPTELRIRASTAPPRSRG